VWLEGMVVRGRYRILSQIGRGGMATVYKAEHVHFRELRALKVINPELAQDAKFVRRFTQEGIITRRLQHPNAVRVDDIDQAEDGVPFIVMEYIEGRSLKDVIKVEGPLPVARVCAIATQVAAALGAAHDLGMVHRDVKPDNIVLVAGGSDSSLALRQIVKVLDFGIAKLKEMHAAESVAGGSLTGTGMVIGTPQYMSPEQAMGKSGAEIDQRSDIYSLGIVMYEMLTGSLPFDADTATEWVLAHVRALPKPVRDARPELPIPDMLAGLTMRCLEKNPELRPPSAAVLIKELERVESSVPSARGNSSGLCLGATDLLSSSRSALPQGARIESATSHTMTSRSILAVDAIPSIRPSGLTDESLSFKSMSFLSRHRMIFWLTLTALGIVGCLLAARWAQMAVTRKSGLHRALVTSAERGKVGGGTQASLPGLSDRPMSPSGHQTVDRLESASSSKAARSTVRVPVSEANTPRRGNTEVASGKAAPADISPVITDLAANPPSVKPGQAVNLRWSVTGAATSVSLAPGGTVAAKTDNYLVYPSATTTYTLVAQGRGAPVERTVVVEVVPYQPPVITQFYPAPKSVSTGETARLMWTTSGEVSKITVTPGRPVSAGETSTEVAPQKTTAYTLEVTGPGGTASSSATVIVNDTAGQAEVAFAKGRSLLGAGKREEAAVSFSEAMRDKPDWYAPLVERGQIYVKLGLFPAAIDDYNQAIRLKPNDPVILNLRGYAYYGANKFKEAIADFNEAIRLAPDMSEAYENRGNAKWKMGDKGGGNYDFAIAKALQEQSSRRKP